MASNFSPECGLKCRSKQHALELISAVTKGTIEEVKAYFRLCYNAGQCCDVYGRTVLHVAAACGKDDIVEWILLEKQGDLTLKDAESGWTALHRAAFYGQLKTARLLILYNSDNYTRDQEGLSPLDLLMYDRPVHVSFSKSDPSEVYTWGDNVNLTIGHSSEQRRITPEPVELFRKYNITVSEAVLCKYHTVFLTKDGQVYTCGHGHGGRLGHGDEQTCLVPRKVECLSNNVCKQIAAARDHTVFLTEDGTVYSCGLNDSHQLGQFPTPTKCLSPKLVNGKNIKGKSIQGICVGRFHTVLYSSGGVFTFGLNAGQLGHPKGTEKQSHPRLVSYLNHKDTTVVYAVCSDAATVCLTTNGDIYVLHEYHCRKIASKWQEITRIEVCGGNLDHNTDLDVLRERGGSELMIALLNATGKVFMWRACSPSLKRCRWMIRRQLTVTDFSLSSTCLVFITDKGEAFLGSLTHRKATTKETGHQSKETTKEIEDFEMRLIDLLLKEEVEEVMVRRIPSVHRGTNIFVDSKGRNFAALQSLPSTCLTDVPTISGSEMIENFSQLFEEADEYDLIHDVIIGVGERSWPAHQYILLSRCDYFNKLLADARKKSQHDVPIITVNDVHPDIFELLLMFIYTDSCDLLTVGSKFEYVCQNKCNGNNPDEDNDILITSKKLSAFGMKQKKTKNGQKENQSTTQNREKNPVKVLQDIGRKYGVKGLSKRLECVVYRNGVIEATNKQLPSPSLRFDRHKHQDICDVCIKAEDTDHVIQCHKSVLVARLEYFHSMLGSGWIETSNTETLTLPVAANILEIVIDFLYTDECKVVTGGENIELLCNILVVADQMLITRLRELCEVALSGLINLKNVGELLEISSLYNASQLMASCQQFILINLSALMEARLLDVVSDEVLQDLEKYYHKQVPSMSRRILTPYQDGPSKSYLEELASELPEDDVVVVTSRKSKPKRRKGSRTKSLSEDTEKGSVILTKKRERQISMSSDTSYRSEEEMESLDILATSPPENEIMLKERRYPKNKPSETTSPLKVPPKDKSSMLSMQSPPSSLTRVIEPTTLSQSWVATPSQPHLDPTSPTAQMSPGFSLRDIMEEEGAKQKSSNTWKIGKFSWKEAKKHQSQIKAVRPPNQQWNLPKNMPTTDQLQKQAREVTSPESQQRKTVHHSVDANKGEESSPWGGVNKVCKSFRELMVEDENQNSLVSRPESSFSAVTGTKSSLLSWGLPTSRVQKSRSELSTSLPKDTVSYSEESTVQENPWHKVKVQSPTSTAVSFTDIVKDEIQKHETRARATTKPLGLIQIEEQAIQELLRFYGASENFDEHITVERVPQEMAAPLWMSVKQQNKPGFQLQ